MAGYLIRRVLLGLLTLLLITMAVYGLIRMMPGDPLATDAAMMNPEKMPARKICSMKAVYGLDKSVPEAYIHWLGNMFQGDFDSSFAEKNRSLMSSVRVVNTLKLTVPSLILAYLFAMQLACFPPRGKTDERLVGVVLYMLYAIPSFIAALFLQLLFAVKLEGTAFELPLMGIKGDEYESLTDVQKAWDQLSHMILPVISFTYVGLAYYSRFIKAHMEEVSRQDYIRTAKAKGLGPVKIMIHHAFRNTLIPFVTLLGLSLPALLGGAIILEQVFNWPGMGQLYFRSILTRDYPVIMGLTLALSVLTLLGQLFADMLYAFVDPRISYK